MGTCSATSWLALAASLALLSKTTEIIVPVVFLVIWCIDWIKYRQRPLPEPTVDDAYGQ